MVDDSGELRRHPALYAQRGPRRRWVLPWPWATPRGGIHVIASAMARARRTGRVVAARMGRDTAIGSVNSCCATR